MYDYLFNEGVSIGWKIPITMNLLKVTSGGPQTAQIPIVRVATGQSKSFCSNIRSIMNFAKVLIFLSNFRPRESRSWKVFKRDFARYRKAVIYRRIWWTCRFFLLKLSFWFWDNFFILIYLFLLQDYSKDSRFGRENDWRKLCCRHTLLPYHRQYEKSCLFIFYKHVNYVIKHFPLFAQRK